MLINETVSFIADQQAESDRRLLGEVLTTGEGPQYDSPPCLTSTFSCDVSEQEDKLMKQLFYLEK